MDINKAKFPSEDENKSTSAWATKKIDEIYELVKNEKTQEANNIVLELQKKGIICKNIDYIKSILEQKKEINYKNNLYYFVGEKNNYTYDQYFNYSQNYGYDCGFYQVFSYQKINFGDTTNFHDLFALRNQNMKDIFVCLSVGNKLARKVSNDNKCLLLYNKALLADDCFLIRLLSDEFDTRDHLYVFPRNCGHFPIYYPENSPYHNYECSTYMAEYIKSNNCEKTYSRLIFYDNAYDYYLHFLETNKQ